MLLFCCCCLVAFSSLLKLTPTIRSIGGTYLTLLNTIANLGGTWPVFFCVAVS